MELKILGRKFSENEMHAMAREIEYEDQSWRSTVAARYADFLEAQADQILDNVALAVEQQSKINLHSMVRRNTQRRAQFGGEMKRKALALRAGSLTVRETMGGKDDMDDKTAEEVAELAMRVA